MLSMFSLAVTDGWVDVIVYSVMLGSMFASFKEIIYKCLVLE